MNYKKELTLGLSCLLLSFFCFMVQFRTSQEEQAAAIAPDILRFHVLANSDSKADQALKLEVRDVILQYMQKLPASDKETFCEILTLHLTEIEQLADQYIAAAGYTYQTSASLVNCHFPPKTYGDNLFPEGNYDALRITIGQGKGRNWWCVLYPQLCFTDAVSTNISPESEEQLKMILEPSTGNASASLPQATDKNKSGCLLLEDRRPKVRFLILDLIAP